MIRNTGLRHTGRCHLIYFPLATRMPTKRICNIPCKISHYGKWSRTIEGTWRAIEIDIDFVKDQTGSVVCLSMFTSVIHSCPPSSFIQIWTSRCGRGRMDMFYMYRSSVFLYPWRETQVSWLPTPRNCSLALFKRWHYFHSTVASTPCIFRDVIRRSLTHLRIR